MDEPAPGTGRAAARWIVDRLRQEGHESYFVGGAVRDELLGTLPHEYDVATSALPEQTQALFEHAYAVGARFGVVKVVRQGHHVDVATFRSDDAYVDGRRPTGVRFGGPKEDAERRDFTVNGLFLDPDTGQVTDLVGGRADLEARVVRAIGDPRARFAEDKLRMLRAIRFATTLSFTIEEETWNGIREMADTVTVVSWERIRNELSKILLSGRSAFGLKLLHRSGLLARLLPEIAAMDGVEQPPRYHPEGDVWVHTLLAMEEFDRSEDRSVELALATLLHDVGKPPTFRRADRIRFDGHDRVGASMSREILKRLRYPGGVVDQVEALVAGHMAFTQIRQWREAKLKRFARAPLAERQLELHRIDCLAGRGVLDTWNWVRERREAILSEPPPPTRLVTGHDLVAVGYRAGRQIGKALAALDDEILEGRVHSKEEAIAWVTTEFPPEPETS